MNLIKKRIKKYLKENIHLENELKTNLLLFEYDFNS